MGNNTVWFDDTKFNEARVIERIADLVVSYGGIVKFGGKDFTIKSRGYIEQRRKKEERIEWCNRCIENKIGDAERTKEVIKEYEKELTEMEEPHEIKSRFASEYGLCATEIRFRIDSVYYYFGFADNAFDTDPFCKIQLGEEGEYYGRYYCETLTAEHEVKDYFLDDMWSTNASDEAIDFVANEILNRIMESPLSEKIVEKQKKRVPNVLNDGWHFETVYVSDNKRRQIDF